MGRTTARKKRHAPRSQAQVRSGQFRAAGRPQTSGTTPPSAVGGSPGAQAGDRVIDIGCGIGYWLLALLDAAPEGVLFTGVDIERTMLERLEEKLKGHPRRGQVTLLTSTEHELPVVNASQDVAVLGLVYHELADRKSFLKEIKRTLAPGGRLAIIDWDALPPGVERTMGPPIEERVSFSTASAEALAEGFRDIRRVEGFRESYAMITVTPTSGKSD